MIGAGPAGLAAAVRAAESGARVAMVDDNPHPGGQIWRAAAGKPQGSGAVDPVGGKAPGGMDRGSMLLCGAGGPPHRGRKIRRRTGVGIPQPDSGDRRARALPSLPRLDAAQSDGRRRATGAGEIGPAGGRKEDGDCGQRSAAAGGGEISEGAWRGCAADRGTGQPIGAAGLRVAPGLPSRQADAGRGVAGGVAWGFPI